MSDTESTGNQESAALSELRREAEAAAGAADLHEQVRQLTLKALTEKRLPLGDAKAVLTAITEGVGNGLAGRGGELREGLRQALSGLDQAVGSAAEAMTLTLREAVSQGRAFTEGELKTALERVRDLESQLVESVKAAAQQSGGKLKEELERLAEHMRTTGTDTGARIRQALEALANGASAAAKAGQFGVREVSETARDRLSQVASGVLAALAESLRKK
jgi:hypothetical protein